MYRIFDPTIKRSDYLRVKNLQRLRAIQAYLREVDPEFSDIDKNQLAKFSIWINQLIERLNANIK
jgi:hypothetical protein